MCTARLCCSIPCILSRAAYLFVYIFIIGKQQKTNSKSNENLHKSVLGFRYLDPQCRTFKRGYHKLFKEYNKNSLEDQKKNEGEYQHIQTQIKNLKIRLGMGEIDKETYNLTFEHLNEKLLAIGKEMNTGKQTISNLEELINKSLEKLENIKDLWLSGNLEDKRRLNKTLFPEGIYFDPKKHKLN